MFLENRVMAHIPIVDGCCRRTLPSHFRRNYERHGKPRRDECYAPKLIDDSGAPTKGSLYSLS